MLRAMVFATMPLELLNIMMHAVHVSCTEQFELVVVVHILACTNAYVQVGCGTASGPRPEAMLS